MTTAPTTLTLTPQQKAVVVRLLEDALRDAVRSETWMSLAEQDEAAEVLFTLDPNSQVDLGDFEADGQ